MNKRVMVKIDSLVATFDTLHKQNVSRPEIIKRACETYGGGHSTMSRWYSLWTMMQNHVERPKWFDYVLINMDKSPAKLSQEIIDWNLSTDSLRTITLLVGMTQKLVRGRRNQQICRAWEMYNQGASRELIVTQTKCKPSAVKSWEAVFKAMSGSSRNTVASRVYQWFKTHDTHTISELVDGFLGAGLNAKHYTSHYTIRTYFIQIACVVRN